jgi:hypothetical protein
MFFQSERSDGRTMDAKDVLCAIGEAFHHAKLDAVMIGNAAAAIQGAPVTTLDIDFCVRDEGETARKLSRVARELEGELLDLYPFYQIQIPERALYLDFLCRVVGIESFEDLRDRSMRVSFDGVFGLDIACLEDVIRSKEAAGQEKDLAVLPLLRKTLALKNEAQATEFPQDA